MYHEPAKLIINADDFGYSRVFNEEILKLMKERQIKSTTVMVYRVNEVQLPQINELKRLKEEGCSVGIHLEISGAKKDPAGEIKEQYLLFKEIFGSDPSHLDMHMPRYFLDIAAAVEMGRFGRDKTIPVRNLGVENVARHTTEEAFFVTNHSIEQIYGYLDGLREERSYELIAHPGRFDPESKSSLNKGREEDIIKIKRINDYLSKKENTKLISYNEL